MIFSFERRILAWIHEHILLVAVVAATIISLLIRYTLRYFVSLDASICLLPWYDQIKANGGVLGLGIPVDECNYNFPYLVLIAIMTYIPIESLFAYKIVSCLFDYLLAFIVSKIVGFLTDSDKKAMALSYIVTIISPVVFINSAAWAQCDAIYCFFIMWSIYLLLQEKELPAFIVYGFAFAFKFQSIFVLPFYLFYYVYKKKFSIIYFLTLPIPMIVLSLPALLQGRTIAEMISINIGNTSYYPNMALNYPSFWNILNAGESIDSYDSLKNGAILLVVVVLGTMFTLFLSKKVILEKKAYIYIAFISTYAAVLLLPSMHERYGFLYEIFAIVIVFMIPKTFLLLVGLIGMSLTTYGSFLYYARYDTLLLSVVNVAIFGAYCIIIYKEIFEEKKDKVS